MYQYSYNLKSKNSTFECRESRLILMLWDIDKGDPHSLNMNKHIKLCKSCQKVNEEIIQNHISLKNQVPKVQLDIKTKESISSEVDEIFKKLNLYELEEANSNIILRLRDNVKNFFHKQATNIVIILIVALIIYGKIN